MRNTFSESLYQLAKNDPSIVIVVADISPAGSMSNFQKEYPERFINVGVAEQVMIGIAAGLAAKGLKPFTYTIAAFSLYRPFEMIRVDLGYQNLPVTIVGMGAGLVYSTLGSTHHTQEDIAIASTIPNMQILAPCDPLECIDATKYCAIQKKGPVYLRIGKAGEPVFTSDAIEPFIFGKIRYLKKGADICIISYGPIIKLGLEFSEYLDNLGISCSIISCHTLKPLDITGLKEVLKKYQKIFIIEEHVPQGGLTSQLKQLAWDINSTAKIYGFTLKDEFIHNYGTHEELLDAHGISLKRIVDIFLLEK